MITEEQKKVVKKLMQGYYLMKKRTHTSVPKYKLYHGNMIPEHYVSRCIVDNKPLKDVLKKDKLGRITLNLSLVRGMHGRSWIKKEYKKLKLIGEERN